MRSIFVNLPVVDVGVTRKFFASLGFGFNEQFSNEDTLSMVVSEGSYVMFLQHPKFQGFSPQPIASGVTEVLTCLSCSSRAEVDALVARAVEAGGKVFAPPQDHGFMYGHGFQDPDGHVWELMWMDPAAVK